MSRTASTTRWIVLSVAITVGLAFAWSILSPASADAQQSGDATVALAVSEAVNGQPFRTVAVAVDPGTHGLAALGATLSFDTDAVNVTSCDVSEAGACNVSDDGTVLVSVFNLNGLQANDQLMTVKFEPLPDATATQFALQVTTAVKFDGSDLPEIVVAPLDVVMTQVGYGSLTGQVVSADSETALFGLPVCLTSTQGTDEICSTTSGLGTWRFDDLAEGEYTVQVSDPSDVYAGARSTATVVADQVATADDMALLFAADAPAEEPSDESESIEEAPAAPTGPVAEIIVYEASIAGRVTAVGSGESLQGMQVCATQPLVLHQSCGSTDIDGVFTLSGLSTGNYWVTVSDPLARYEEAAPKLVGVVTDRIVRGGVKILLKPIAE